MEAAGIGIISTLIGTATATALDSSQRLLHVGDQVCQDEIISTGALGAVEIEFSDGSIMALGRESQAFLDQNVFNSEAIEQCNGQIILKRI